MRTLLAVGLLCAVGCSPQHRFAGGGTPANAGLSSPSVILMGLKKSIKIEHVHRGSTEETESDITEVSSLLPEKKATSRERQSCGILQIDEDGEDGAPSEKKKYLFLVSDRSGNTASHLLTASFYQFGECGDDITVQVFSNVQTQQMLVRIVRLAQRIGALVCFTLADPVARTILTHHCVESGVESLDLIGDLSDQISTFLNVGPPGTQCTEQRKPAPETCTPAARKQVLSPGYFARCAAVDYAIKMNNGANLQMLSEADIVLIGLSRCQKTPLSIYLAHQFALKVANVPLSLGKVLDPEIFEVDPRRVFLLHAQPDFLGKIRRRRVKIAIEQGVESQIKMPKGRSVEEYASPKFIEEELEYVRSLVSKHHQFRAIDVTGISVEEIAHDNIMSLLPRTPTTVEVALESLACNFLLVSVAHTEDALGAAHRDAQSGTGPPQEGALSPGGRGASRSVPWDEAAQVRFCSDGLCLLAGRVHKDVVSAPLRALLDTMRDVTVSQEEKIEKILGAVARGVEVKVTIWCRRGVEPPYENEVHVAPINSENGEGRAAILAMHPLPTLCLISDAPSAKAVEHVRHRTFYTVLDASADGLPLRYASKGFFKLTSFSYADVYGDGTAQGGGRRAYLWAPKRVVHSSWTGGVAVALGKGTGRMGEVGGGRGESGNPHLLHSLPPEELLEVQNKVAAGESVATCFSAKKSTSTSGLPLWIYARLEPVVEPHSTKPLFYVGIHHAVS